MPRKNMHWTARPYKVWYKKTSPTAAVIDKHLVNRTEPSMSSAPQSIPVQYPSAVTAIHHNHVLRGQIEDFVLLCINHTPTFLVFYTPGRTAYYPDIEARQSYIMACCRGLHALYTHMPAEVHPNASERRVARRIAAIRKF
ncbi:hypothetical protein NM688_g561 [Phlebia brevispora]|uniref:Uncharacterized protein n=1 Tax=Phlebia brevispora TaxID=194682 RepID=A0ACC1TDS5_9APHY|nr:hypothetical protein NM688_g561 [Phlebia brevispora]